MKAVQVERLELIGGPEDGLMVDGASLLELLLTEDEEGVPEIPMFIQLVEDLGIEAGVELKLVRIGRYVCEDPGRERLKYHWVG